MLNGACTRWKFVGLSDSCNVDHPHPSPSKKKKKKKKKSVIVSFVGVF